MMVKSLDLIDKDSVELGIVARRLYNTVEYMEREDLSSANIAQALIGFTVQYSKTALDGMDFGHIELIQAYIDAQRVVENGDG